MGSRLSDLDSVKRRSEVCCLSCDPCVQLEASDHVIPSEDVMGPRPATMHENSLFGTKSFISNRGSGYFHGSEGSAFSLF